MNITELLKPHIIHWITTTNFNCFLPNKINKVVTHRKFEYNSMNFFAGSTALSHRAIGIFEMTSKIQLFFLLRRSLLCHEVKYFPIFFFVYSKEELKREGKRHCAHTHFLMNKINRKACQGTFVHRHCWRQQKSFFLKNEKAKIS